MTTIYLIRHGESTANVDAVMCGITECDLSDLGYAQIKKLAAYAPSLGIDIIYTSPIGRAVKTANALNWYINKPLIVNDDLREINLGKWEGEPWSMTHRAIDLWFNDPQEFIAGGGEPMTAVYDRMAAALNVIADENDGKTIAVVSHGCALCNLILYVKGLPVEKYKDIVLLGNTSVTKIIYDKTRKKYTVIYENELPMLGISKRQIFHRTVGNLVGNYQTRAKYTLFRH